VIPSFMSLSSMTIISSSGRSICLLSYPLFKTLFFSHHSFLLLFPGTSSRSFFCIVILTLIGAIQTLSSHRPSSCTWTWVFRVHMTYTNTNKEKGNMESPIQKGKLGGRSYKAHKNSPGTRRGRVGSHPHLFWVLIFVHKCGVKSKTNIQLPKNLIRKHDYPRGRYMTYSAKLPLRGHQHNSCKTLGFFWGFLYS
jgi:hypothetical protein